ncbi:MAG TPA: Cys-tRNA(Pro) deacylase [Candidatus Fournierella merdigallinarum]|nr:Cys-tRNA(Pro) deacylase [Candidatus Fournierella merdigallinarum]
MAQPKTNAMRMLEKAKIAYTFHEYDHSDGAIDGVAVAKKLGEDPARVFKTLVTQGASRAFYVFVIPVAAELDLKAAARAVGEKSVAMLHVADLLKTTGYVRGGCSPVGMKKPFVTRVDDSARDKPTIYVSAGRIGAQVELAPADLLAACGGQLATLTAPGPGR